MIDIGLVDMYSVLLESVLMECQSIGYNYSTVLTYFLLMLYCFKKIVNEVLNPQYKKFGSTFGSNNGMCHNMAMMIEETCCCQICDDQFDNPA